MKKTKLLLALCITGCIGYAQPTISTIAGTGTYGYTGDGGPATSATFKDPQGVAVDGTGNIYIADAVNNVIRKINTSGTISTIAGTGTAGFSGDAGAATSAKLNNPVAVALDASGNLFIADANNGRIRKVNTSGIISTYGGGGANFPGDGGAATSANISTPYGIKFDASGDLFIATALDHLIRKITVSTGIITTIAGTGFGRGTLCGGGYTGDGGAATSAKLNTPRDIAFDASGNMYIADMCNSVIRKVNTSGTISTFAGSTNGCIGNGGTAISAKLSTPQGLAIDAFGNIYVSDDGCGYYIRQINPYGIINAYAGNGTAGFTGDGFAATAAELNSTYKIAFDNSNNMYITDLANQRIRKVTQPYCPANAGSNETNVCGKCCSTTSVTLGTSSISGLTYSWTCSGTCNLSSTTASQPTAAPCNTVTPTVYTVTVSGTGCATNTSTVQVTTTLPTHSCCKMTDISIQNQDLTTFAVYPNPCNNQVTITLYDKAEYIRILDVTSKMIFETKSVVGTEFAIDISKYAKGVYFVIAKIGDKLEKQKLIIE